jgi:hypothetical protein
MPVPATLPSVLAPTAGPCRNSSELPDNTPTCSDISFGMENHQQPGDLSATAPTSADGSGRFRLAGLIPPSRKNAAYASIVQENKHLWQILKQATAQIEQDYAHKLLMEDKNKRLQQELYGRSDKVAQKRAPGEGEARLLTSDEQLDALALYDWKRAMELLLHDQQTKNIFKQQRQKIKVDKQTREEELQVAARMEASRARAARKRERELSDALERARRTEEKKVETAAARQRRELEKLTVKAQNAEMKKLKENKKEEERAEKKRRKEEEQMAKKSTTARAPRKTNQALTDGTAVNSRHIVFTPNIPLSTTDIVPLRRSSRRRPQAT